MRRFFSKILLLSLFFLSSNNEGLELKDRAFYALSSLQEYFRQILSKNLLQEEAGQIFSEEDLANLWASAASEETMNIREEMIQARRYFEEAGKLQSHDEETTRLCLISKTMVFNAWSKLNPYLSDDDDSLFLEHTFLSKRKYSALYDNPCVTAEMRQLMKPYLLPFNTNLKKKLDALFASGRVIENEKSFKKEGFDTIAHQPMSKIRVARHPSFPGYLFKVYLDTDPKLIQDNKKENYNKETWMRLTRRCDGAERIRRLIHDKKLIYFTVPDKWIYPPPLPKGKTIDYDTLQILILIVTDMQLVPSSESQEAWKYKISPQHLDELYCILSHGFASAQVAYNIPYCKNGLFACVDTENPQRVVNYSSVRQYLSSEMQEYWNELIRTGGKLKYQ